MTNSSVFTLVICLLSLNPVQARSHNGGPFGISCDSGSVIHIVTAEYLEEASTREFTYDECNATDVKAFISRECNGKQQCSMTPGIRIPNELCWLKGEHPTVNYICLPSYKIVSIDDQSTDIDCELGSAISVLEAKYGHIECSPNNVKSFISKDCDSKSHCSVNADWNRFGDPCVGREKTLDVSYMCTIQAEGGGSLKAGTSLDITCPSGHVLEILGAKYGPQEKAFVYAHCNVTDVTPYVAKKCDGKPTCTIERGFQILNALCVYVSKTPTINYVCIPSYNAVSSGGENKEIECEDSDSVIQILDGMYGRSGCHFTDVTSMVAERCNQRRKCSIDVESQAFEDVCPSKTVDITYTCYKTLNAKATPKSGLGINYDCYYGNMSSYAGTMSGTEHGYTCQRWDTKYPHYVHDWYKPSMFPDNSFRHNYCRYTSDEPKPWCYTTYKKRVWDYCNIHACEAEGPLHVPCSGWTTCGDPVVEPSEAVNYYKNARVVGGSSAINKAWPWTVMLFHEGKLICGAGIISDRMVLTAAHCFKHRENPTRWKVVAGQYNLTQVYSLLWTNAIEQRQVQSVIMHEKFTEIFENDIAILVLKTPLTFGDTIKPICMPNPSQGVTAGQMCWVAGWGAKSFESGTPSTFLQQIQVPVISPVTCSRHDWYGPRFRPKSAFCAGYTAGKKDTCTIPYLRAERCQTAFPKDMLHCPGDSGGPIIAKRDGNWFLQGIVSWGEKCAVRQKPGIYTDVSKHTAWIHKTMQTIVSSILFCNDE